MVVKKPSPQIKPAKVNDYEKLGKALESVFASEYVSRARLYWVSFSRGIFIGLGIAIGSTLVLAFLLWLLSQFTELPLIGELAEKIGDSINN